MEPTPNYQSSPSIRGCLIVSNSKGSPHGKALGWNLFTPEQDVHTNLLLSVIDCIDFLVFLCLDLRGGGFWVGDQSLKLYTGKYQKDKGVGHLIKQ